MRVASALASEERPKDSQGAASRLFRRPVLPDISTERRPPQSAVRFTPVVKHSYLRDNNGTVLETPWGKGESVRLSLQNFNRHRKKRSLESEYGPYLQKSKATVAVAPRRE